MEKQDFSKMLITDSKFYRKYSIYEGFFQRNNIKTIDQLFEGTFDGPTFAGHKLQYYTAHVLRRFIEILKHEHLGEPLYMAAYLDNTIDLDASKSGLLGTKIQFAYPTAEAYDALVADFFGTDLSIEPSFGYFLAEKKKERKQREEEGLPYEEVKVIDFFTWLKNNSEKYPKESPFLDMYINEYERMFGFTEDTKNTAEIAELTAQLNTLVKQKEDIDSQISTTQQKIAELCDGRTKGVIL